MKYVVSRYNQDTDWIKLYSDDVVLYDRSEIPQEGSIIVPNIGTDLCDKFTYIIDNYDNLPDVAVYTKANLFKYVSKEEFEKVKDNKTFTPLLTQNHQVKKCDWNPSVDFTFYLNGMYYELNNGWYLNSHPCESDQTRIQVANMVGLPGLAYVPFAPGSNYILPKENILKYPREFYYQLRSYLMWNRYPGEAQIIERGLYNLWS
jgi:hypothetical protein